VKERIEDRASAAEVSTSDAQDHRIEHGEKAGWLAPIPLEAKRNKVREKETDRRAGNKGCLPMSLDDYLELLDWTGRQFRTARTSVARFQRRMLRFRIVWIAAKTCGSIW